MDSPRRERLTRWVLLTCWSALLSAQAQAGFAPPRFLTGSVSSPGPQAVGGGQVWLEVSISPSGGVTELLPLRSAAAFDAMVEASVRNWRFSPASRDGTPIPSAVFVAVVIRPPDMYLLGGQDGGTVSTNRSPGAPRPVTAMMPPYPPNARGEAVVVVQATIGPGGVIESAEVIQSGDAAFDDVSLATARQWRFTPAPTPAYLVFVFREPVVIPGAPRR